MNVRRYTSADHAMLANWWVAHKWPIIPEVALPKVGLVIENKGIPVCAGFLYQTDSVMAWLEFIVSNPACDTMERGQALDLLIEDLSAYAKELGFMSLFTSSNHTRLMERYKEHNFQLSDSGVSHFVRNLCQ